MKTIGMIGGLGWESTILYYKMINQEVNRRLGAKHSARILMYSYDFEDVDRFNREHRLPDLGVELVDIAKKLETAGAQLVMICANTPHMFANLVSEEIGIPFVHIADATGIQIQKRGLKKVALLGTKLTMEQGFITGRLEKYGLEVIVPENDDRKILHKIIYDELVVGKIIEKSRKTILHIMDKLTKEGAEGIILGCTDFALVVNEMDTDLPLFDTTRIHALAAVDMALAE